MLVNLTFFLFDFVCWARPICFSLVRVVLWLRRLSVSLWASQLCVWLMPGPSGGLATQLNGLLRCFIYPAECTPHIESRRLTGQGVGWQGNKVLTDRRQCRRTPNMCRAPHGVNWHTLVLMTTKAQMSFTRHTSSLATLEMPMSIPQWEQKKSPVLVGLVQPNSQWNDFSPGTDRYFPFFPIHLTCTLGSETDRV